MVAAPGTTQGTTLSVLLVEDDPDDRTCFAAALRRCDSSVQLFAAGCGASARQRLATLPVAPHVVFLDLHLPGTPAPEFAAWVRAQRGYERVLIIALTGNLECACVPPAKFGADALLVKPISPDDLQAMLTLVRAMGR